MPEIKWLLDSGMVTLLSGLMATNAYEPTLAELERARTTLSTSAVTFERLNALALRKKGIDAVALAKSSDVGSADDIDDIDDIADRDAVVRIALNEFPAPSDATPWESIEDFRRDKEARDKFWALKSWINKTAKAGLKQYEVVDELQSLMNDYAHYLRLHKMKTQVSVLEVLVTTTVGIAEGMVKFKWANAAKSIFKVGKANIALLEDERGIPGKEVAYIADAWKWFST